MSGAFRIACLLLCATATLFGAGFAAAQQTYPNRPIKVIVGNSPGTAPDLLARTVGTSMAQTLGQPVVIETKEGAGGMISFEYVAKQVPADGYTIVLVTLTSLATLPATVKDLRFDVTKDLEPIILMTDQESCLASSRKNPWKSWEELVAQVKANPGKYNYGTSSLAGWLNLLTITEGLDLVRVPYKGGAPMMAALLAQDIAFAPYGVVELAPRETDLRVLVCTGEKRYPLFPDAPTYGDLGVPGIRGVSFGLSAPRGTPKEVITKLYDAASQALRQPEIRSTIEKSQQRVLGLAPDAMRDRIADEVQRYTALAKKAGVEPQ